MLQTVPFPMPVSIVQVAAGLMHCTARNYDGMVFSWGDNACGQLGIASEVRTMSLPRQVSVPPVKHIACGYDHTVVVTGDHKVFAWGSNTCDQLGLAELRNFHAPVEVDVSNVESCEAMATGTVFCTTEGELLSTGENHIGQLSLGHWGYVRGLQQVPIGTEKVQSIACGTNHFVALTRHKRVMTSDLDYGMLRLIPGLFNVKQVAANQHTVLALDVAGALFCWRPNSSQIGAPVLTCMHTVHCNNLSCYALVVGKNVAEITRSMLRPVVNKFPMEMFSPPLKPAAKPKPKRDRDTVARASKKKKKTTDKENTACL